MAYENFNDSARRTASDKILRDIAFDIAKNPKCDGYQRGLVQWFIISLIKKKRLIAVLKWKICQTSN